MCNFFNLIVYAHHIADNQMPLFMLLRWLLQDTFKK